MTPTERIFWWLTAGSRGGANRQEILRTLLSKPQNAHQLAKAVVLDYKTVRHHLKLLETHNLVSSVGSYGEVYFVSEDIKKLIKKEE